MKNNNLHIISSEAELDRLLEAYYDGSATQQQIDAMARYFRSLDSVPDRYVADAALLDALIAGRAELAKTNVPAHLGQAIADATYGRSSRAAIILRYVRWISAAAVLVLLAVVGARLQRSDAPAPELPQYAASVLRHDTVVPVVAVENAVAESAVADTILPLSASGAAVHVAGAGVAAVLESDPYVEVTDSASVEMIVGDVLGKLGASLALADRSVRKADIALNDISETINKTLRK